MDPTTIAVGLMSAKAQSFATSVAVSVLKSDFGSQKAIAALLASSSNAATGAANLAAGIGGNLDVTA